MIQRDLLRGRVLSCFVLATCVVSAWAENPSAASQPTSQPAPRLSLASNKATVEPLWAGTTGRAYFELKNEGDLPLTYEMAGACAAARIDAGQKGEIAAGQKARIELALYPPYQKAFFRTFKLQTNDPQQRQVELTCTAPIRFACHVEPGSVMLGDILRSEKSRTGVVKIRRGEGGPLKPRLKEGGAHGVRADLREVTAGELYELEVTAEAPWPQDMFMASVTFETGVPEAPERTVQVHALVCDRLIFEPAIVCIPDKTTVARDIPTRLFWCGGPAAKIKEATIDDPHLKVQIGEHKGQPALIVTVPADFDGLEQRRTLRVVTDDASNNRFEVPVLTLSMLREELAGQAATPASRPAIGDKQ